MGATPSHPASDQPPNKALHVLRVIPGSPASVAGIQVFFDFIVGIEGGLSKESTIDAQSLERIVESHEGKTINLIVWSSKFRTTRLIPITPSRKWATDHPSSSTLHAKTAAKPSLLGLSMRICEPEYALDHVWHILEILEGSPAESAGLVPYGDWVVGWSGGVLSKEGDFYDLVEQHEEKPLRVYVYSYDFDTLREVVLVPNRMWGGEGLLGCGVGYGLLHRIPQVPVNKELNSHADEIDLSDDGGAGGSNVDGGRSESLFVPADEYPEYDASSAINGRAVVFDESDDSDAPQSTSSNPRSRSQTSPSPASSSSNAPQPHLIRSGAPSPPDIEPLSLESPINEPSMPLPPKAVPAPAPIPISAPVPKKPATPLNIDPSPPSSHTPRVTSSASSDKLTEYRRRSSTPDTLRQIVSPRVDEFSIRRVGSPRLGFGGMMPAGLSIGMERKSSLSPSTPKGSTLRTGSSAPTPSKAPVGSVNAPEDVDAETEDGSEGDTVGGSITSVD